MKFTKKEYYFLSITSLVILLDQLTKYFVTQFNPSLSFDFISIIFAKNTGAAFGKFQNQTFILSLISILVVGIVVYNYNNFPKNKLFQTSLALFLGGAIGNGIDRLLHGFVVDFIYTPFWPTFNIADSALTISVIGFLLYLALENKEKKKLEKKKK